MHGGFGCVGVFDHVAQRFLDDTEETESDMIGDVRGYVVVNEVDLQPVLIFEFLAETARGRDESLKIEA